MSWGKVWLSAWSMIWGLEMLTSDEIFAVQITGIIVAELFWWAIDKESG